MRSKVKVPDNGIFMAERFEPQFPAQIENEKKPSHLMDVFPMGDGFLEHYRAIEGKEQKTIEIMRDVVYTFLDQELKNTRIFKSEALGAEFPFTVVSVKELAAEIFLHYENLSEVQILAEKKDEERDAKNGIYYEFFFQFARRKPVRLRRVCDSSSNKITSPGYRIIKKRQRA